MKKELEGFVLGSKAREKVLLILAKGHVLDGETIARKGRIMHSVCLKTLDELEEKGLVSREQGGYRITKLGIEIENMIRER